jgi:hypothetical protein
MPVTQRTRRTTKPLAMRRCWSPAPGWAARWVGDALGVKKSAERLTVGDTPRGGAADMVVPRRPRVKGCLQGGDPAARGYCDDPVRTRS